MSKTNKPAASPAGNRFQFTLAGLILFSLCLMAGSAGIAWMLDAHRRPPLVASDAVDPKDKSFSVHVGPWGELRTRDIELERPVEYLTDEVNQPAAETWVFPGRQPDDVRVLLLDHGLAAGEFDGLLTPTNATVLGANLVVTPDRRWLLSLEPAIRRKFYLALTGLGVNYYLDFPYIFPADSLSSLYHDPRLEPGDAALLKQLLYPNNGAWQLSDYQLLLREIPTVERRVAMSRVLSRQSAVLAGLNIRPDSDIDKIADYWGNVPNVRIKDIRPLMEALKALPEGGSLGLVYLLPPFARDRLYTFPLPPAPGDPAMDCHWSTFNFSNEKPDNRFNDPAFAAAYLRENFYQVAAPSIYGDILLLMNDRDEAKHSAVYIADDLVFTKNGNNYRQPWMLMRIPDLLAMYPSSPPLRVVYMRRKVE